MNVKRSPDAFLQCLEPEPRGHFLIGKALCRRKDEPEKSGASFTDYFPTVPNEKYRIWQAICKYYGSKRHWKEAYGGNTQVCRLRRQDGKGNPAVPRGIPGCIDDPGISEVDSYAGIGRAAQRDFGREWEGKRG